MILRGDFRKDLTHAVNILRGNIAKEVEVKPYSIKFKYADIEVGEQIVETMRVFNLLDLDVGRIKSITFDVYGLNKYATEVEITDDFVVFFPKRDENEIKKFLEILGSEVKNS